MQDLPYCISIWGLPWSLSLNTANIVDNLQTSQKNYISTKLGLLHNSQGTLLQVQIGFGCKSDDLQFNGNILSNPYLEYRILLGKISKRSKDNSNSAYYYSLSASRLLCVCVKLRRENLEKKQYQEKQTATTKNSKQIKKWKEWNGKKGKINGMEFWQNNSLFLLLQSLPQNKWC